MTRQDLFYVVIIIVTAFVIWAILGGSGAPFSSYVSYSALLVGCEGGLYFADKYGRD